MTTTFKKSVLAIAAMGALSANATDFTIDANSVNAPGVVSSVTAGGFAPIGSAYSVEGPQYSSGVSTTKYNVFVDNGTIKIQTGTLAGFYSWASNPYNWTAPVNFSAFVSTPTFAVDPFIPVATFDPVVAALDGAILQAGGKGSGCMWGIAYNCSLLNVATESAKLTSLIKFIPGTNSYSWNGTNYSTLEAAIAARDAYIKTTQKELAEQKVQDAKNSGGWGSYTVNPDGTITGVTYTKNQADAWRYVRDLNTTKLVTREQLEGAKADLQAIIDSNLAGAKANIVAQQKIEAINAQLKVLADREQAAKKKAHDDKVAARTRDTNQAVAGAIAINIIAEEFINPELQEFGAQLGSSIGGNFENPEVRLGVSVDLAKHFGEDFEGVSVNAGFGVESGELAVGARKTWRVAEYVQTSVGVSIGAEGVRAGPEVMFGNADFGIGVAMWGPVPVPQIKILGYTASIVPHLALANAVVGGATIAYKAVRAEMKAQEAVVAQ